MKVEIVRYAYTPSLVYSGLFINKMLICGVVEQRVCNSNSSLNEVSVLPDGSYRASINNLVSSMDNCIMLYGDNGKVVKLLSNGDYSSLCMGFMVFRCVDKQRGFVGIDNCYLIDLLNIIRNNIKESIFTINIVSMCFNYEDSPLYYNQLNEWH